MSARKKIALIVEYSPLKGYYPFQRASSLAAALKDQAQVHVFLKHASQQSVEAFIENATMPILFEHWKELYQTIRNMQFDLIVVDSDDLAGDVMLQLKAFCPSTIQLDYVGDNETHSLAHLKCLLEEPYDIVEDNVIHDTSFFLPTKQLVTIKNERLLRALPITETHTPPHIVIYYEDGDPQNCTYRTLRHLIQLQIPLQISVILDDYYAHSKDELHLMVLSRKRCKIVQGAEAIMQTLIDADCLICNHTYTPYKAAYIQIPCITTAQYEKELNFIFPSEENGFIHIGLGRKMKQSHLQNAVMELLLHAPIRAKMLKNQQAIRFDSNEELLKTLLLDLAEEPFNISSYLK